ncbi:Acetolactate synthase [Syntrophobotulus glycolicus DSM 8271]|uniref:Acetolactate synthase n=1 Tax=Syntrophobotulus glycolicus (strain DSM 8271 / FlGlyR) TaxID=645991 RepID=F0T0Y9_SYNGF|nr:thiamine pyrophosphate-binding protein [Syntrophobotulus glycolicus]ADY57360.1 Acetolactate synthase [Syntrophobotulus glycolicus DSM 8271]
MALWGEKEEKKTANEEGATTITCAELLARFLQHKGVEHLFGIPGAAILPFYDAVREQGAIRSINVRHEQMAAFMADGYYRATGKMAVCAATSGPGATNFLTGLYGAYGDATPMLAITGQVPVALIGKDAFQEAPIVEMAKPVTKAAYLVDQAFEMPFIIKEAWNKATTGKRGPVLLDLPLDVQKTVLSIDLEKWLNDEEDIPSAPPVEPQAVQSALSMIRQAQKPVIMVGGGVNLSNAHQELRELAELLNVPVVATLMGKDCFPNDHALYAGMVGTICNSPYGNKTLLESDLVINLGGRFSDRTTGNLSLFTKERRFIQVNIDSEGFNKSVQADLNIHADVKNFMTELVKEIKQGTGDQGTSFKWKIKERAEEKQAYARRTDFDMYPMKPQRAIAELRKYLDRDAVVTHDCGISQILSSQIFEAYEPKSYLITGRAGNMGWGLGAAMAAKLAYPEKQCVNLLGDGSLGMSIGDLATAAKHNIPIVVFLLNNSLLGLIRQQQNMFFDKRWISTDLQYCNNGDYRGIDFVTVAKGFGLGAEQVQDPNKIGEALDRAFTSGRPYLIELLVDPQAMCSVSTDGTIGGVQEVF